MLFSIHLFALFNPHSGSLVVRSPRLDAVRMIWFESGLEYMLHRCTRFYLNLILHFMEWNRGAFAPCENRIFFLSIFLSCDSRKFQFILTIASWFSASFSAYDTIQTEHAHAECLRKWKILADKEEYVNEFHPMSFRLNWIFATQKKKISKSHQSAYPNLIYTCNTICKRHSSCQLCCIWCSTSNLHSATYIIGDRWSVFVVTAIDSLISI